MTDITTRDALVNRYGEDLVKRVEKLCAKAAKEGYKIATAESATAGGIAHLIASVNPTVLARGNIVYNNWAKKELLGVFQQVIDNRPSIFSKELNETYEAVTSSVAEQMARGALTHENAAQISVSVTGYAGAWGDTKLQENGAQEDIPGGTVFIGAGWKGSKNASAGTQIERFQFDAARTLDIRSAIVAAVGALEIALEKQLGSTPEGTIAQRYEQAKVTDPWLKQASRFDRDYAKNLAGEPEDPLLQEQYGAETVQKVKELLDACKEQKLTIAVTGDPIASEICHLLTTVNGSSRVVDRGQITPSDSKSIDDILDEQKANPAHLIVAAKTGTDGEVKVAIAINDPTRKWQKPQIVQSIPLEPETETNTPVSRQAALAALDNLPQHILAQQAQSARRA